MAADDSEMHAMELSLESAARQPRSLLTLRCLCSRRSRNPIAREITKLPPHKPRMRLEELVRTFPRDLLRKCDANVTALQRVKPGLAERDIAVEVVGVGVFSTTTLALMKSWHIAMDAIKQVQKAVKWVADVLITRSIPPAFHAPNVPDIVTKLQELPFLSQKVCLRSSENVALAYRLTLSCYVIKTMFRLAYSTSQPKDH